MLINISIQVAPREVLLISEQRDNGSVTVASIALSFRSIL